MIRIVIALCFFALPLRAEEVVAGLSQTRVSITANFDGSEILVFGAVKRSSPAPAEPIQVIVTVSGPSVPVTVRKKARRFGIWVNTEAVEVDAAPSFYAIATSGPFGEMITSTEDLRHRVSISRAIRSVGAPPQIENSIRFTDALIRVRTASGLYKLSPNTVAVNEETLFNTAIALPANLTEGNYTTRILLTRGGRVIDTDETELYVQKVGLERWIYNLAHEQPFVYGILSLVIAITAGWGASAIFRYIRN